MNRLTLIIALSLVATSDAAQTASPTSDAVIRPADNLVVENIPPIPASVAEKADQYGEFRVPPGDLTRWISGTSAKRVAISISRRVGCQSARVAARNSPY